MKTITKWLLCVAVVLSAAALKLQAAQTERLVTFALTGYVQTNNSIGDPLALAFRATTKEVLEEISLTTGQDFNNGVLLLIESLDDTNAAAQFVARKVIARVTNELDVTELFPFSFGDEVATLRYSGDTLKNATFYAIDDFAFDTLAVTNAGIVLDLQGFSKQTEIAFTKTVGASTFSGFAANLTSDVNGELRDAIGLIGPVKGKLKIGPPKFVASPSVTLTSGVNATIGSIGANE
jgi:hypothetical protein